MKKYISILGMALMAVSCLDVEMVDTITTDNYYKTELQVTNAIEGVYSTLTEFEYHKTNWPLVMTGMEDAMFASSPASGVQLSISNNTMSASTGPANNFWGRLYGGINAANEVLEKMVPIEFKTPADKERIVAEARFLRALFHYDLLRMFGSNGIPIRDKATTGIDNAYVASSPTADVYDFIIGDLVYAAGKNEDGSTRLPLYKQKPNETHRVSNGAAHALLADVYNTMGRWQDAIDQADIVIESAQYELLPNYADLWNVENKVNAYKEHIFAIPFFRDRDAAEDNSLGSQAAHFYCPNGINEDGTNLCGNPFGKGQGGFKVQQWFIRYFQDDRGNLGYSDPAVDASTDDANLVSKDYRIEVSFFRRYYARNNTTLALTARTAYPAAGGGHDNNGFIKKYIDPYGVGNRTNGNDMPRLRLSDMYLIKAEAHNELDEYTEACKAIDVIRERVRKANGTARVWPKFVGADRVDNIGRTLTKDEFRWLVFMERGLEFAGEQKRWFDLKRMRYNDATSMYNYMMNEFIPAQAAVDVNAGGVLAERKRWMPIPPLEVTRNPGVKQNPGY